MIKEDGKKVWLGVLEEHMAASPLLRIPMTETKDKLKAIKFTYGGDMKKFRKDGTRLDKAYEYALRHFPTLLKIFENKMGLSRVEEVVVQNGNSVNNKTGDVVVNTSDSNGNQCALCGRISASSWAFVKVKKSRLSPEEKKKITAKDNFVCRDRSYCRKKQEKQTSHKNQVTHALRTKHTGKRKEEK